MEYPSGLLHCSQGDISGMELHEIKSRMEMEEEMEKISGTDLRGINMGYVDELLSKEESKLASDECVIEEIINEMDELQLENTPISTRRQENWSLRRFQQTLEKKKTSCDLDNCSVEKLAVALRIFYAFVRREQNGQFYSPATLICLRAGMFRIILHKRGWNIIADKEFTKANSMLRTTAALFVKNGGSVKQFSAIESEDLQRLSVYFDRSSPKVLQQEVYFVIVMHFGLRGREWLRRLGVDSFEKVNINGVRSFRLLPMESKNVRGSLETRTAEDMKQSVLAETLKPGCPYAALDLYLEEVKASKQREGVDNNVLFLRPKVKAGQQGWYYAKQPVGHNTLGSMMSDISKSAGLSKRYTSHCIRTTLVTELDAAGVALADISRVTGHKSVQSTERYVRKTRKRDSAMLGLSKTISNFMTAGEQEAAEASSETAATNKAKDETAGDGAKALKISTPANFSGSFTNCTFNINLK